MKNSDFFIRITIKAIHLTELKCGKIAIPRRRVFQVRHCNFIIKTIDIILSQRIGAYKNYGIAHDDHMKKENKKRSSSYSPFDPSGSYTGAAKDGEKPVQDSDDL